MTEQSIEFDFEVVVVGGGAAGLSGALMLGRARRSVLVIDAGQPRNAPAAGVHGLLGRDGIAPADLLAAGRDEVRHYGGEIISDEVLSVERGENSFTVFTAGGRRVRTRRLLVTTGLVDQLPDIPGLAERWGREVLHCPYCHGWEVRDEAIAVLATGPMAVHQALLWRQWSPQLTLLLNDLVEPTADEAARLAARGIITVAGKVASVEIADDRFIGLRLADGTLVECDAVAAASRMVARGNLLVDLGLELTEHPMGAGLLVPSEPTGRTSIPGLYVAGNVTDLIAQVGTSAAQGAFAAAQIGMELVLEDTDRALAAADRATVA